MKRALCMCNSCDVGEAGKRRAQLRAESRTVDRALQERPQTAPHGGRRAPRKHELQERLLAHPHDLVELERLAVGRGAPAFVEGGRRAREPRGVERDEKDRHPPSPLWSRRRRRFRLGRRRSGCRRFRRFERDTPLGKTCGVAHAVKEAGRLFGKLAQPGLNDRFASFEAAPKIADVAGPPVAPEQKVDP